METGGERNALKLSHTVGLLLSNSIWSPELTDLPLSEELKYSWLVWCFPDYQIKECTQSGGILQLEI